jgi:rod shape determining protein RodA
MIEWIRSVNWPVGLSVLLLCALGLSALASLAPEEGDVQRSNVSRQALFVATGMALMLAGSMIHPSRVRKSAYVLFGAGLAALVALLLFAPEVRGVRAWFKVAGITVQPSEFAKIFMVLALARFAAAREEWRPRDVAAFALLAGIPLGLVAVQPDLGMTLVMAAGAIVVLWTSQVPLKYVGSLALAILLLSPLVYQFGLKEYQKQRIVALVSPDRAQAGKRDQQDQAMRLVSLGGPAGRGLGQANNSGAYYLPERHNDFIFTVVAEELGFLGTLLVLTLFGWIFHQCIRVALGTRDGFARLCVMGLGAQLFVQVVSNIGMNLGLLPVTGLTLPFMSYGGSSLWASFLLAGAIMSVSSHWTPSFSSRELPANQYALQLPRMK